MSLGGSRHGTFLLAIAGSGLLLATAGIHLDLYLTGYRHIPTIGVLFLLQFASGVALALAVLLLRSALAAASAALFAASTLGGWILSLWTGLFGFKEVRTDAGIVAGTFEALAVAAFGLLALRLATAAPQRPAGRRAPGRLAPLLGSRGELLAGGAGLLALVAVALASGAASPAAGRLGGTDASRSVGAGTSFTIVIKGFAFSPATAHVRRGERIVVHNEDPVTHTLTALASSHPQGGFDTGHIAPGTTAAFRAPVATGTYGYSCRIHPFMTGRIVVDR